MSGRKLRAEIVMVENHLRWLKNQIRVKGETHNLVICSELYMQEWCELNRKLARHRITGTLN